MLTVPTLSPTSAWREGNPRFLAEGSLCESMGLVNVHKKMLRKFCRRRETCQEIKLSTRPGRREQSYPSFFLDNVNGSTCQEEPESVVAISHDQSRQWSSTPRSLSLTTSFHGLPGKQLNTEPWVDLRATSTRMPESGVFVTMAGQKCSLWFEVFRCKIDPQLCLGY